MILKRKLIGIALLLSVVLAICFVTSNKESETTTAAAPENRPQIILDAGHEEFSQHQN